ncbi:DUF1223 domain-containing protein [Ferruginibacter yonginensis]|uniref:DUF1223 domain-containing protein n=1 Tax=Ferruginibacter yonginensis TaxID=1310416 RepID=A0ABV8QW74_9BACT
MRLIKTIALLVTVGFIAILCFAKNSNNANLHLNSKPFIGVYEPVAVLELFTSQGCSSCPSADKLLKETIINTKGKKIFALSFHVDYWNRLGWADPFSNKAFSKRQSDYVDAFGINGSYTPQLVVNGNKEFVGSDNTTLYNVLNSALNTKTAARFKYLFVRYNAENAIQIDYELEGNFRDCDVNFALVSNSETTVVKRGENGGRTLENDHVVRQFITKTAATKGTEIFATTPTPAKNNASIVAYIQQKNNRTIIGATATTIQ